MFKGLHGGLVSRRRFWAGAVVRGWKQLVGLKDHLEIALTLLVGALALGSVSVQFGGPWYVLGLALAFLAFIVLDGAYLEWKEIETPTEGAATMPEIFSGQNGNRGFVQVRNRAVADTFSWRISDFDETKPNALVTPFWGSTNAIDKELKRDEYDWAAIMDVEPGFTSQSVTPAYARYLEQMAYNSARLYRQQNNLRLVRFSGQNTVFDVEVEPWKCHYFKAQLLSKSLPSLTETFSYAITAGNIVVTPCNDEELAKLKLEYDEKLKEFQPDLTSVLDPGKGETQSEEDE